MEPSDEPVIPLAEPCMPGNERRYLEECLTNNFVSSVGPFVERFEQEFAETVGARHAIACASGTAAIHVALRVLDLQPGDEVIVPTLTFIASVNPIVYERAKPLLADVEEATWNLDPELCVEELERRAKRGLRQPRAIEVVHLLGHPARLEPLVAACERYGVVLVEDAAEALGARYTTGAFAGRHVGTIGKLGCFSFNGNKVITTGGGGMIVTDDEALARRAKHLTTQARLPGLEYRHDEVGFNYRLTNVAAALGVAQLEQLAGFLVRKRESARRYDTAIRDIPGLSAPPRADWADPSFWLYTIQVDEAGYGEASRALVARLRSSGIHARPIWTPLHTMPLHAGIACLGGAVAERIFSRAVSLPSSVHLAPAEQERVVRALARLP